MRISLWFSTFALIFSVIDPFGYVPIFLGMTADNSDPQRRSMLKKACFAAFAVLALFTLLGTSFLHFFGISLPALQIAGGIILLAIGFEMLKVIPIPEKLSVSEEREGVQKEDISIVPLAIPMLAGPASIATVVILGSKAHDLWDYGSILVSILATLTFTYLILRSAAHVLRFMGQTGLRVLTRIMGLLLCAMAVQFVINGYLAVK
jgi:multiple antibiotic resistance protein